jgi:hypothetical protein
MTKTEQENLANCVFLCDQHERRLNAIEAEMRKFCGEMREAVTQLLQTKGITQCQTQSQ